MEEVEAVISSIVKTAHPELPSTSPASLIERCRHLALRPRVSIKFPATSPNHCVCVCGALRILLRLDAHKRGTQGP